MVYDEIKNKKTEIFIYTIEYSKDKPIIRLYFTVDFFEYNNEKFIENKKSRILIETDDFQLAKKDFGEIINIKIRDSIMNNKFYDLLTSWNFERKDEREIIKEKTSEINMSEYYNLAKIDINKQFKYSSAMINRFDQHSLWRINP